MGLMDKIASSAPPTSGGGGGGANSFSRLRDAFPLAGNADQLVGIDSEGKYLVPIDPATIQGVTSVCARVGIEGFTVESGTWSWYPLSNQYSYGFMFNGIPGGNGDEITYNDLYLTVGTYTLGLITALGANGGVATVKVDGNSVGTVNMYNSSDEFNHVVEMPDIVISESGFHDVSFEAAIGSGGQYSMFISRFELRRQAT